MYLRSKTFTRKNGTKKTYLYLVEARRFKDKEHLGKTKVRQITIASLGEQSVIEQKIPQVIKHLMKWSKEKLELLNLTEELKPDEGLEYGLKLIFENIWQQLGLKDIINSLREKTKHQFNLEQVIFSQVLNRVMEPTSELGTYKRWVETIYGLDKFELHQYYRALDFLFSNKDKIEQGLFNNIKNLFNMEVDLVLFDTTSVIYRGDGQKAEQILNYGFSKEKRFDLKQVIIGVLMSKTGIPLAHFVWPGNTNDFTALDKMLQEAKEKFPIRRVVFVFDKGMTSQSNLKKLSQNKEQYIAGVRMRQLKEERQNQLLKIDNMKSIGKNLKAKEVFLNNQRYIVCFNKKRAKEDKQKREEVIARLKENLKTRGLKSLFVSKEYAKYVVVKAEKPFLNTQRIKREEFFDGKYVLTTNNHQLSFKEVIRYYKDLQKIERAFRTLKNELEVGPIYHYTERRIRAHIMVVFLSLVLRIVLEKKLKETKKDFSFSQILTDIKKIKAVKFKVKDKEYVMRTEIQGQAYTAFQALSFKPPPRVLKQPRENLRYVAKM